MKDQWLNMWNERYSKKEFAYGTEPNVYFKNQLARLEPGKILLGAEGEGRNAIYAARLGWEVSAFDISEEGKNKALMLAKKHQVKIDYRVGSFPELGFEPDHFDAIGLIYAHFPPDLRQQYFELLNKYLKEKGQVIFEAFGKNHLAYREKDSMVGGPPDFDSLYSTKDLEGYFPGFQISELTESEVELSEGLYHNGFGSVTRFCGLKQT